MEDRNLFKAFKRIAHNLVDLKVAQNIQAGRGPTLTDKDKREIIRQAWEEAFSIENMRSSWAQTGFRLDPIHGYVCDQRVLWELLAEEERVVQAKRAAGVEVADDLNYDVFNIRKGAGGAANDESDSDSDEDEDIFGEPDPNARDGDDARDGARDSARDGAESGDGAALVGGAETTAQVQPAGACIVAHVPVDLNTCPNPYLPIYLSM